MMDTGHRTQDTGHRTQDTGHRTQAVLLSKHECELIAAYRNLTPAAKDMICSAMRIKSREKVVSFMEYVNANK